MTIGIYGLGRFGQFWAALLAKTGARILGYNRSPRAVGPEIEIVTLEALGRCDCVFICTAISSMSQVCTTLAPHLAPDTVVFDTCSVKMYPAQVMAERLPLSNPIIPLHPMFGPDSANQPDLPLVICPDPRNHSRSGGLSATWQQTFITLGLRVLPMTPEEHDQEAARTQGITHFIGRILGELDLHPSPIGTLGYRKIFEVREQTCNDPWQLFVDLQRYNPYTKSLRTEMDNAFRKLMGTLETLTEDSGE